MSNNPRRPQKNLTKLARTVRASIRIITIILPLLYAWLSFSGLSFREIVSALSDATALDIFWKTVLLIYYTGWVFGSTMDTNFHEDVALGAPYEGRLPTTAVSLLAGFLVLAALLLYSQTYEQFVVFFTAFFISNLIGYAYIVRNFTKPMLRESRLEYERQNDFFNLERLSIFERYMLGRWQIWRFLVGALMISAMIGVAVLKFLHAGRVPYLDGTPIGLLQAAGMLCFVAVMEIWIFAMRIKARAGLAALDELASKYELQRLAAQRNGTTSETPQTASPGSAH